MDCKAYDALINLPERTPDALLADKGYDADAIRADLAEQTIAAVIPGRSNRRVKIEHDRTLYNQRNRIERMLGHLKINSAIATRYDQLAKLPRHGPSRHRQILPQICPRRQRVHLLVAFRQHDDINVRDVGLHRQDIFGEIVVHRPAIMFVDFHHLVQRRGDTPNHATHQLAAAGLLVDDPACGGSGIGSVAMLPPAISAPWWRSAISVAPCGGLNSAYYSITVAPTASSDFGKAPPKRA